MTKEEISKAIDEVAKSQGYSMRADELTYPDFVPTICISRRDYFAGMMLNGLLSDSKVSMSNAINMTTRRVDEFIEALDKSKEKQNNTK